ncbi:MAG: sugar phosphate nucleotidyltransferase, partial [Christensenellales bacterium]
MVCLLLSGGSGKRLWPLSNEKTAKQFIKILKDEQGESISMLQRNFRQVMKGIPDAVVYAVSNEQQKS